MPGARGRKGKRKHVEDTNHSTAEKRVFPERQLVSLIVTNFVFLCHVYFNFAPHGERFCQTTPKVSRC